ncbi:MAG: hypothetical protein LQ338_005580 [Usnochroma carphineum]|nr:MAG: hypothetical protein LQ338_005580 [Usnochroma carphineum]
MSLLSPSRSRYTLAIFLWLSMLFLIRQHYHGLSQLPGRPVNKGVAEMLSQLTTSTSDARLEEKQSPGSPPAHPAQQSKLPPLPATASAVDALISSVEKTSLFFVNDSPQPSEYSKMGDRLQILSTWLTARSTLHTAITPSQLKRLDSHIERTILTLFAFVRNPSQPKNAQPFTTLRQTFLPHSSGIVMVGSKSTLHSLAHTILNIRTALNSSLPIQVFHAGESDFPSSARRFIKRLSHNITIVDLKTLLSDSPATALEAGGLPTLRVFSALASTLEHLLLIEPGTTFLQPPDLLLTNQPSLLNNGASFFHSHLYGKNANKATRSFWHTHLKNRPPSPALRSSRAYNEGYAEEIDAGVVLLDKSRLETLMGLLHVCWQNTKRVREEHTYKYAPDERDSWWFGFELAGVGYAWGDGGGGYAGTVGWLGAENDTAGEGRDEGEGVDHKEGQENNSGGNVDGRAKKVCGNTVLHLDHTGIPLWYSGSLVTKWEDNEPVYEVPEKWTVDGVWQEDTDCMVGGEIRGISEQERRVLEKSVELAKEVDGTVHKVLEGEKNRG